MSTPWIVTVNCVCSEGLLQPSDFLERIANSNFRDTRNVMPVAFGFIKMSFWAPKKRQL